MPKVVETTDHAPELVAYRTHIPSRVRCIVCRNVLPVGELAKVIFVERDRLPVGGTTMFACEKHAGPEITEPACAEIKRRADALPSGRVKVLLVHEEGPVWRVAKVVGDVAASRKVYEAVPSMTLGEPAEPVSK